VSVEQFVFLQRLREAQQISDGGVAASGRCPSKLRRISVCMPGASSPFCVTKARPRNRLASRFRKARSRSSQRECRRDRPRSRSSSGHSLCRSPRQESQIRSYCIRSGFPAQSGLDDCQIDGCSLHAYVTRGDVYQTLGRKVSPATGRTEANIVTATVVSARRIYTRCRFAQDR
jgi:hypothetical protein